LKKVAYIVLTFKNGGLKMELNKGIIERAKLPVSGQSFLWDDELTGFGVRLTPTTRTYIVQARINGVTRRITLGRHGVLTVQQARKKALQELLSMLGGKDPVKEKKRAEAHAVTLKEVVEAYIKDRRSLKESSKKDIRKHLNKSFSAWADKPIISITRDKALSRFRELSDRSPAQANQAYRILRALFNYAMGAYRADDTPIILENPVKAVSDLKIWNHVNPRSGKIPLEKVGAVWNLLQELRTTPDQTTIGKTIADAVCFLMLTGCRWSEMSQLTWDRVDPVAGWHIDDPKNRKPVTFPLSDIASEILKDRPHKGEFVFQTSSKKGYLQDARNLFVKISEVASVHISAHDLRRTFRSIAGECEIDFWKVKLLMGHKISGDVTIQHYTETNDLSYLKKDIDKIASWIVKQGKIAASVNVLPFPDQKKGGDV
jgi:integrase